MPIKGVRLCSINDKFTGVGNARAVLEQVFVGEMTSTWGGTMLSDKREWQTAAEVTGWRYLRFQVIYLLGNKTRSTTTTLCNANSGLRGSSIDEIVTQNTIMCVSRLTALNDRMLYCAVDPRDLISSLSIALARAP